MDAFPLKNVVVVGGGAGCWLAAAALARVLGPACPVRVIERRDPGGAIAAVPSLHRMLGLLRIDERTLVRDTDATFRLGAEFRDWGAPGERYFQGFGVTGSQLAAVPFQHHWLRLAAHGPCPAFEEFSVAAQAALLGRFAPAMAHPQSILSNYAHAWHLDAAMLTGKLRAAALAAGATAQPGEVDEVELDDDGFVRALRLAGGDRVDCDFVIDCSDLSGAIARAVPVEWDDWSAWLPCDRVIRARGAALEPAPPHSTLHAHAAGWRAVWPLRGGTEHVFAYSSTHCGDQAAFAQVQAIAGAACEPRPLLRARPRKFWRRNVLCLPGDALDPLESPVLHLTQSGIMRFLAHLPVVRGSTPDSDEYNRLTGEEYDRLRDLLAAHYRLTRREEPLWQQCREVTLPDSLAQRLELFADSGRLSVGEDEYCGLDGWLAVLLGQGPRPRSYDPLADLPPLEAVRDAFTRFAADIRANVARMPEHSRFITQVLR